MVQLCGIVAVDKIYDAKRRPWLACAFIFEEIKLRIMVLQSNSCYLTIWSRYLSPLNFSFSIWYGKSTAKACNTNSNIMQTYFWKSLRPYSHALWLNYDCADSLEYSCNYIWKSTDISKGNILALPIVRNVIYFRL